MSKLERLLNLTAALLETGRPLVRAEIWERVPGYPSSEASYRRAFERDKEDLRDMGVPIDLIDIPGSDPPMEGYRIPKREYYLRDPGLEPDELAALHLAAGAVRFDGVDGTGALQKLGGSLPDVAQEVDPTPADGLLTLPSDPHLGPLFSCVSERRVASFDYRGERRSVEPLRLDYQRGHWYVLAVDRERGAERNFRVDRMSGPIDVGEPGAFDRPAEAPERPALAPWDLGEGDRVTVTLEVDAHQALWALHHLGSEAVSDERPDGSLIFTVDVANEEAFRSFVLMFLDHAVILKPADVRSRFVEWLEALL